MKKFICLIFSVVVVMVTAVCFVGCNSELVKNEIHTFDKWYVSVEPTCEAKGEERMDCKTCKHYETKEIQALGHDIVSVEAKEATHLEVGYNAYEYCKNCDYTTYVEIPAIAHEFVETISEPTCYSKGYTEYVCECGYSYQDNFVNEIAHEFGEYEVTLEASCETSGKETRYCANCEAFEEKETQPLGHLYDIELTEATCVENGLITYTCHCGYKYAIIISATGHIESDLIDGEDGVKYIKCEKCEEILQTIEPEQPVEPEE